MTPEERLVEVDEKLQKLYDTIYGHSENGEWSDGLLQFVLDFKKVSHKIVIAIYGILGIVLANSIHSGTVQQIIQAIMKAFL